MPEEPKPVPTEPEPVYEGLKHLTDKTELTELKISDLNDLNSKMPDSLVARLRQQLGVENEGMVAVKKRSDNTKEAGPSNTPTTSIVEHFKNLVRTEKMQEALIDLPAEAMAASENLFSLYQAENNLPKNQKVANDKFPDFFNSVAKTINCEFELFLLNFEGKLKEFIDKDKDYSNFLKGDSSADPKKYKKFIIELQKLYIQQAEQARKEYFIESAYASAWNTLKKGNTDLKPPEQVQCLLRRVFKPVFTGLSHPEQVQWSKKTNPAERSLVQHVNKVTQETSYKFPAAHHSHNKHAEDSDPTTVTIYFKSSEPTQITRIEMRQPSTNDGKGSLKDRQDKSKKQLTRDIKLLESCNETMGTGSEQKNEHIYIVRLTSLSRSHYKHRVPCYLDAVFLPTSGKDSAEAIDELRSHQTDTARGELDAIEKINKDRLGQHENPSSKNMVHFMQMNINRTGENLAGKPEGLTEVALKARLHNELAMLATLNDNSALSPASARDIATAYTQAKNSYHDYLKNLENLEIAADKKALALNLCKSLSRKREDLIPKILNYLPPTNAPSESNTPKKTTFYTLVKLLKNDNYLSSKNTWLSSALANSLQSCSAGGCKSANDRYKEWLETVRAIRLFHLNTASSSQSIETMKDDFLSYANSPPLQRECKTSNGTSKSQEYNLMQSISDVKNAHLQDSTHPAQDDGRKYSKMNSIEKRNIIGLRSAATGAIGGVCAGAAVGAGLGAFTFFALKAVIIATAVTTVAIPPVGICIAVGAAAVGIIYALRKRSIYDTNNRLEYPHYQDAGKRKYAVAEKVSNQFNHGEAKKDINALLIKNEMIKTWEHLEKTPHLDDFRLHWCLNKFFKAKPTKTKELKRLENELKERLKVIDPELVANPDPTSSSSGTVYQACIAQKISQLPLRLQKELKADTERAEEEKEEESAAAARQGGGPP